MSKQKIYVQHEENVEWMNKLLFYRDELNIMKRRLAEVASKNSSKEIIADLKHFQNSTIVASAVIDEIKHEINLGNNDISREIHVNPGAAERKSIKDHSQIREQIETFEKTFSTLKTELNLFLIKWM